VTQPIAPSFCSRCGAQVNAGAHFCTVCGTDVSGEQASLATAQVTAQARPPSGDIWAEQLEHLRQSTLGEYEVLGELGRGGMAAVYLAHEFALDRKVAVKVMSPSLVSGAGMIERFKREARTAASLSHPHIIPVYAVRETDRLLYFVMKFIAGRPLDGVLKELGPLPIPMIQMILQQVGSAFGYAHRRGIIHRDIKPANIMIDEEGWAVVTDFGIAKVSQAEGLTMTGMTVGTPTYMSPEQCMAQDVTGASDQYSLGVVAYEMITGRPPFSGGSMMAIMYGHFNDPPPDISVLRPDCPPELRNTVMRMLEKEPGKRWPSMEDAVDSMGEPPAKSDDAMRTQLVEIAKKSENTAMLQRFSTPVSPAPLTKRTRPGTAAPAAGRPAGPSTAGASLPRTGAARAQPVVSGGPASSGSKTGLFIGLGAVAVVAVGLALWRPWAGKTEPISPVAAAPARIDTAAAAAQQPPAANPGPSVTQPPVTNPQPTAPGTDTTTAAGPPATASAALDPAATQRSKREFQQLLARHKDARSRALAAGASQRDLSPGDNLRKAAERLSARGEWAQAIGTLNDGIESFGTAELAAKARTVTDARLHPQPAPALPESTTHLRTDQPPAQQQAPAPAQLPPPVASYPAPAPAPPVDERPAVELVLREFARALFARDLSAMLAAWPSMPARTRDGYKKVFDSKNYMDTNGWRYLDISVSGSTATATLGGVTVLLDSHRKVSSNEPFPRKASLEKVEGRWRLTNLE
jgi:serine/threonine protein kinase